MPAADTKPAPDTHPADGNAATEKGARKAMSAPGGFPDDKNILHHKPSDADLVSALVRHATGGTSAGVRGEVVARRTLKGGYAAKTVERIDLALTDPAGSQSSASFVLKACLGAEVSSLVALRAVPGAEAAPDVVVAWQSPGRSSDQQANGFVNPFYPGGPLTFDDRIPEPVLATLARVHAHCHGSSSVEWTWTFDRAHFRRQHERAMAALDGSANFRTTTPDHAGCLRLLERLGRSEALAAWTDALPRSLTHGDMHPGNIVLRRDGSPVVIDWGNACVAPPMLDLANIVRIDSPEWQIYLAAYREARGEVDEATCRRAYWWARAATGLQYLPWVAEHTAGAEGMVRQVAEAEAQLRNAV